MTSPDQIAVQIVDDQEPYALGLPLLIAKGAPYSNDIRFLDSVPCFEEIAIDDVHVVICDLHLGLGMSGFDAILQLTRQGIPVVAISGMVRRPANIADAIGYGASAFVSKDGTIAPSVWRTLITSAHSGTKIVTSALALALMRDADDRPLLRNDLTTEARSWLRVLHLGADSPEAFDRQTTSEGRRLNGHVWKTAEARTTAHAFHLTKSELEIVRLRVDGLTWQEVAVEMGCNVSKVEERLKGLRKRWLQGIAIRPMIPQGNLARYLYDLHLDRFGNQQLPDDVR